ncbi:uncharacterized protein LOC131208044 [Anopheles bellator]|uniref:uncharacterized protein LOC131208044 n=1 Tax=Anopheles bellator TaxID=139047 RepID=UPI002648F575|nr:uncharacterized protein LOC131208044 [Anopheles bellator]
MSTLNLSVYGIRFPKTPPLATCFLLFLLVAAYQSGVSAKGTKQKRLLIDLSDPLLTVTDPTVYFHHQRPPPVHLAAPTFPTPTFYAPPPHAGLPPSYGETHPRSLAPLKPATLFNGNLFQYSNYGSPFPFLTGNHLGLGDGETYVADGRILKQYAVMEFHAEERDRNLHHERQHLLQNAHPFRTGPVRTPFPAYLTKFSSPYEPLYAGSPFGSPLPTFATPLPQLTPFNPRFGVQHDQQRSPLLTKNHGPIALGSGSLGYIHGPNGVTVGSGSLGYISHQQHRETLAELIERKKSKHLPSPLTFGHNHN